MATNVEIMPAKSLPSWLARAEARFVRKATNGNVYKTPAGVTLKVTVNDKGQAVVRKFTGACAC